MRERLAQFKPKNQLEVVVHTLIGRRLNTSCIQYEQLKFRSAKVKPSEHRPDFNLILPTLTVVLEATGSSRTEHFDPKERERIILTDQLNDSRSISWMILYLENCATQDALMFSLSCLDWLISGTSSFKV